MIAVQTSSYVQYKTSLALVRNSMLVLSLLAFLCQLLIEFSFENFFSNLLALVTFTITCMVVFNPGNARTGAALTATVIFLIIAANSLAPVIGTLLELHPLTETLLVPVETYLQRTIFAGILISAHIIASSPLSFHLRYGLSKAASLIGSNILLKPSAVWGLGIIGLMALFCRYIPLPVPVSKFLDGFQFLINAPFILLIPPYSKETKGILVKIRLFILYVIVASLSLSSNSRMGLVGPIAAIASAWIISLLLGYITVNIAVMKRFLLYMIFGLLLLGQFSDLSTAILMARANRTERSAGEQLQATFAYYLDKQGLSDYKQYQATKLEKEGAADEVWQENYVRNPFLARFIQIKFDDNCLYRMKFYDEADVYIMRSVTTDKILSVFPEPVLEMLDLHVDKKAVSAYSIGDLMDYLSGGSSLGSFLTGSIPAHAFVLFGWWYPLILIIIFTLILCIVHAFVSKLNRLGNDEQAFSTLALIIPFVIFTNISLDGITQPMSMLLRNVWQIVLIYWVVLWLLRFTGILGFPKNKSLK